MADAGDTIIATVLIILGLLVAIGGLALQILLWLSLPMVMIAGVLMIRGSLGANGYVGWAMIIAPPAVFILPGFMPALTVMAPVGLGVVLVLLGIVKAVSVW